MSEPRGTVEPRPDIETVRQLAARWTNWGRWGSDDELGTLNHLTPEHRVAAAALVRTGEVFSLAIPLGDDGPQTAGSGRFNPIHLMRYDGRDFTSPGSAERDPRRQYLQNADDILILPLQAATQWDGLAHVFFEQRMYNGYSAAEVSSSGARRNAITSATDRMVGRGVLLDLPAAAGVPYLDPGTPIGAEDLERAARRAGVQIGTGDFVLVRTGHLARARDRGAWGDYAGGPAPGLGLDSVSWIADREIAGIATDTWSIEAVPAETPDVMCPVHILLIVMLGLWVGEIFDLEVLAERCAAESRFDFLFLAPPLPVTGGVGSPINPQVVW